MKYNNTRKKKKKSWLETKCWNSISAAYNSFAGASFPSGCHACFIVPVLCFLLVLYSLTNLKDK